MIFSGFIKIYILFSYNVKEKNSFPWSSLLGLGLMTDPLEISLFDFDILFILDLKNPVSTPFGRGPFLVYLDLTE